MSQLSKGLAKFFAVIFAILFSLTLALALVLFNIDRQMFKPETYVAALEKENIYQELPGLVSRMIMAESAPGQNGTPAFTLNLTEADWDYLIKTLLPPEDLKSLTENFLTQFFAYLNGETDTVALPLAALKRNFSNGNGTNALLDLIRTKPVCTLDDLLQIMSGNMPFCNPTEDVLKLVTPLLQEQWNAMAKIIPDQVTVIHSANSNLITGLKVARFIMRVSPMIALGFLFFVTAFAVRTLRNWLQWWGIPVFFAGGLVLILGLVNLPVLNLLWDTFILPRFPALIPTELASAVHDVAVAVSKELWKTILIEGGIITLLGLGAWTGSYFIKSRDRLPS